MNPPDKIYVAESLIKTPYGNEWSPTPYISREDTEYIRKEALLEWAKNWQDELDDSLGASMVHHVLNEIIKEIESL